jgi:hypothetical protein
MCVACSRHCRGNNCVTNPSQNTEENGQLSKISFQLVPSVTWCQLVVELHTFLTANNYDSESRAPKITITTAHIRFSQTSLPVVQTRLLKADVALSLCFRIVTESRLTAP